ncbi:MAG: glycosyltransferase family 2 protein [Alphaproteobacteria bacterium]
MIPAYNAAATLPACLAALAAMSRPPDEIMLFDDGSTDSSGTIGRAAGAMVLRNPGPPVGPAHGRNVLARKARSDLLLFVDADVVVAPDALERLIEAVRTHGADAAFGSYDDDPSSRHAAARYANLRHHYQHQNSAHDATTFWTGLGLIRREIFLRLGGFDERRFVHPSIEDVELGARLAAAGGTIRLAPEAQGKHYKDWTLLQVWRTDILHRAYPWSCLLIEGRTAGRDLNVSMAERAKAVLAVSLVLLLPSGLAYAPLLAVFGTATLTYLWLNRRFFALLARRMSPEATLAGVLMHWFYHVYSAGTYGAALITSRLGLHRPERDACRRGAIEDLRDERSGGDRLSRD